MKVCTADGIAVRTKKDECVGELSGSKSNFSTCSREKLELVSALAITRAELERRKSPLFWISVGAFGASVLWLALELAAPDPGELPNVPRTVAAGAVATASAGLIVFTW